MSKAFAVTIFKAQPIGTSEAPSVTISIHDPLPEFRDLNESRNRFASDAQQIFTALSHSLPGGTLDQLLCIMLEHKASAFKVPLYEKKETVSRELLTQTLKDLFEQHCDFAKSSLEHHHYDHDHISANENAQLVLSALGAIDENECRFAVDRTIEDLTVEGDTIA